MKFSFASLFTKLTLATSVAGALVGCDEPSYPEPKPVTSTTLSSARVLVVNASPGSQPGTTVVDNTTTGQAIAYLSTTPSYLQVPIGLRQVGIVSPNNVKDASGNVLPGVVRQQFASGSSYTVFSTDAPTRTGSGTDLGGIRAVALSDNLAAPATNRAKIRFVNLATSGTYGLYLSGTATPLFTAAPTRSFRAISSGSGTSAVNFANFTEVIAGPYTLDVRTGPTATPVASSLATFTLEAGKIYTLYTRGIAGNPTTPLGISAVQHN